MVGGVGWTRGWGNVRRIAATWWKGAREMREGAARRVGTREDERNGKNGTV